MTYYRCHILRESGDWFAIADIEGDTVQDAVRQASALSDRRPFELWVKGRLVHRQAPTVPTVDAAAVDAAIEPPLAALTG
jgi:hypothetical protein